MKKHTVRKIWRTYGPTLRWCSFRLQGDPPNDNWIPVRITQLIGGRSWSLCVTRTGPIQEAVGHHEW